jgi:hypothetical protein
MIQGSYEFINGSIFAKEGQYGLADPILQPFGQEKYTRIVSPLSEA